MREFTESRLIFRFDDEWCVEKWDEQPAYRAPGGFGSLEGTLACDFIGWHATDQLYLVEVKNFTGYHHANAERLESDGLPVEVAEKVRDTLAGIVWTRGRSFDAEPLSTLVTKVLDALIGDRVVSVHVVLWVDDRPALRPEIASVLQNELRRQLQRWFKIRKVLVTSIALFDPTSVPGLTVRPSP